MLDAMAAGDSILDGAAMAQARALNPSPMPPRRLWPAVAAAAGLTIASLVFAVAMVVSPPVTTQHTAESAPG